MQADKDPEFVSSMVFMRDFQLEQKLGLATNLAEVNSRLRLLTQPIPDYQGMLDCLQGTRVLSPLDVKAAFNNIPLPPSLE